ncbi:MAG: hypothetical protein Q8K52_10110 [Thiobacillus sp.]|nr:hypothetical protein [Thiobacillus sp.]
MGGGKRVAGRGELIRAGAGVLVCVLACPVVAYGQWQVMAESPSETTSIELSSIARTAHRVSFRVRHALRGGQMDLSTQRPMREILARRMVDCRSRRVATLSRAVFSDNDALIHYQASQPAKAEWAAMTADDPLFKLLCGTL